jgi:hypothetical protein
METRVKTGVRIDRRDRSTALFRCYMAGMGTPRHIALASLMGLLACPPSTGTTSLCSEDGGGPFAATAAFMAFQRTLPGCQQDSDCMLIQTPCGQSYENCDFTQVAVPAVSQAQAEELASKLTAEKCPESCDISAFEAPVDLDGGGFFECPIDGNPAAACIPNGSADGGRICSVGVAAVDGGETGGEGNFEAFCDPPCLPDEFCDISAIEMPCGDAGGVYVVSPGSLGTCALVGGTPNCFDNLNCTMGNACRTQPDGGLCTDAYAVCTEGNGICWPACPAAEPICPDDCVGPLDDGRNCDVCVCASCE